MREERNWFLAESKGAQRVYVEPVTFLRSLCLHCLSLAPPHEQRKPHSTLLIRRGPPCRRAGPKEEREEGESKGTQQEQMKQLTPTGDGESFLPSLGSLRPDVVLESPKHVPLLKMWP